MLKNRSTAVCSKKGLVSDHISPPSSSTEFRNRPTASPLIPSPGFFAGFSPKGFSGTEAAVMSPTSILESKPFSVAGHHFISDTKSRACSNTSSDTKVHPWDGRDSKIVGLGIVDALNDGIADEKSFNGESRMVLFGSQLKVRIPSASPNQEPHSLIEYGVKNKDSRLAMPLPTPERRSYLAAAAPTSDYSSPLILPLSPSEMELSEDYTRVISHGPNPKTIHIFDNCTLERCGRDSAPFRRETSFSGDASSGYPSNDFLAFCQFCRKKLGQGKDIFMYRGEMAFCSHECRSQEMLVDDEMEESAAH